MTMNRTYLPDLVGYQFLPETSKVLFDKLEDGDTVKLEAEFDNPYDENAFQVFVDDETGTPVMIGHIDKLNAAALAIWYRQGYRFTARVLHRMRGGQGFFKNNKPKPDRPILSVTWDGQPPLPPTSSSGSTVSDGDDIPY